MSVQIEVFSAGCPLCVDAVSAAERSASDGHVTVHDMRTAEAQARAKAYGVQRVPTVVVDGRLADCCQQQPISVDVLRRRSSAS